MNNILKSFIITVFTLAILILIIYLASLAASFENVALIAFGIFIFVMTWIFIYAVLDDS